VFSKKLSYIILFILKHYNDRFVNGSVKMIKEFGSTNTIDTKKVRFQDMETHFLGTIRFFQTTETRAKRNAHRPAKNTVYVCPQKIFSPCPIRNHD